MRLHDGRHTAATLLLSQGVHPRVVMELLGHSQMRTTMDIYSHVMSALAREAADRMGAVLLSPLATNGNQTGNQPKLVDQANGSRPYEMGGAEGTRTPDPLVANEVRYQLRHSPNCAGGAFDTLQENGSPHRHRTAIDRRHAAFDPANSGSGASSAILVPGP